jgi:hypothetical protein
VIVHNILNPVKLVWLNLVEYFSWYKFLKFSPEFKKNKHKWVKEKGFCTRVPLGKVLSVLQTGPRLTIHLSLWLCRKPPRVLRNRTHDPSPNGTVTAAEEKGGGTYPRRGCSGEGSGEVRGSLAITSRCGSSAVVVGVGWSTCACGGAHRRRGIQPAHSAIVQLNGSKSFSRGQGRHVREEFENGPPDCSVYVRLRATEVRRGRS